MKIKRLFRLLSENQWNSDKILERSGKIKHLEVNIKKLEIGGKKFNKCSVNMEKRKTWKLGKFETNAG